jgi:hypothetical protein
MQSLSSRACRHCKCLLWSSCSGHYSKVFPVWGNTARTAGEVLHVTPSEEGVRVFDLDIGKVAVLICYDINFPELWHQAAALGADLIVWPSAMKTPDPSTYGSAHVPHAYPICNRRTVQTVLLPVPPPPPRDRGSVFRLLGSVISVWYVACTPGATQTHNRTIELTHTHIAATRLPFAWFANTGMLESTVFLWLRWGTLAMLLTRPGYSLAHRR